MSKTDVAAERKNQIVRATVECISKHGYHNFSMQDVARTAGVSKGIIHYYFLNKDDLMMSVLERVASDIERVLHADMKGIEDPVRKLEIFIDVCMDVVKSTKEYYQVNMDFWTQVNQKEDVRKVIAQRYGKFRDFCAGIIAEGSAKKVFRPVDPKEYAAFIVSIIDGMSLQWIFDEAIFDYDRIVKSVNRFILDGLIV